MISFEDLFEIAAARKGGRDAIMDVVPKPNSKAALKKIPDDRWLSMMTKRVFQAGFNWSVIENKWEGFETAFDGFSPHRWAMMSDDDLDTLLKNTSIVRHAKKILSVRDNAAFLLNVSQEHGSAGAFFAASPKTAYTQLLVTLKKDASRLSGTSGQYFLRSMGVDSVIFTADVVAALKREGVVDKAPSSLRDMDKCQEAINQWLDEGAQSLNQISRVLAFTVEN